MDSPPLLVFCFLFTVQLCVSGVILTTFTMVNKCQYTVWPGIVSNAGIAPLSSTGFLLQTGESRTISAPTSWGGRFWGRTQCSKNSTGKFSCVTGDCGSGKLECSGRGATPPATLAEFTLGGSSGLDFFDVSLVDGYNVPLTVVPEGGTGENCKSTGCVVDLIGACPPELKVMSVDGKNGVACKSACEAFGSAEYCCSGAYGSPDKCKASAYSQIFKSACPLAYSYAYDDENSTFTCGHSPDYTITFCASRITRAIARAPTQPFTPPTNSSSSSSNPRRTAGVPTSAPANNRLRPSIPSKPEIVKFKTSILIVVVVVIVALVVLLLISCLAFYVSKEKRSKNYRAVVRNYFGSEGTTLQSLQFTLAKVEDATNKFSPENRIGRGGFGEVYKGILEDGREIAVKKLSKSSGQGDLEFKTEVLLIARLQHRNLVALLGFCLEKTEKLLIYEYVPNKSLDYFLFGPADRRILCWSERHKIIIGIVRGILYLHDHSRLKVIHRDLKPSNILLDEEMNAKISDFGMARIVALSETKGSTNRIVGTYGYMSPEYAMRGQFSEKSDVFSFGVIILEIVSGKRNTNYHEESGCYECFLNYAWRQWRDESVTEILDSNMRDEVSSEMFGEMTKCIHIGLLCVQANSAARPSMEMVLKYLTNDSIELPFPHEPAFFIHPQTEAMESNVGQRPNNLHPFSINQMSLSDFFPR